MSFIDWDPLARAALFGGLFLIALFAVLWLWYDTAGRSDGGWTWRLASSFLVILTVPAVFLGAANLDASQDTLLNVLGFLGIGSAVCALGAVGFYASSARVPVGPAWQPPAIPIPIPETVYEPPATLPKPGGGGSSPWASGGSFTDGVWTPKPETDAGPTVAATGASATAPTLRARNPAEAYLFVKSGPDRGQQFPLDGTATIGRREGCEVVLEDGRVSGEHAQIKCADGNYVFTDLHSTNGSYLLVNGRDERIRGSQVLVDGDHLRLGQTIVEFVDTRGGKR